MELHLQSRSWRDQNSTWTLLEHLALENGWAEGVEYHEVQSTSHSICWLVFSMALLDLFGSMYAQLKQRSLARGCMGCPNGEVNIALATLWYSESNERRKTTYLYLAVSNSVVWLPCFLHHSNYHTHTKAKITGQGLSADWRQKNHDAPIESVVKFLIS